MENQFSNQLASKALVNSERLQQEGQKPYFIVMTIKLKWEGFYLFIFFMGISPPPPVAGLETLTKERRRVQDRGQGGFPGGWGGGPSYPSVRRSRRQISQITDETTRLRTRSLSGSCTSLSSSVLTK